MSVQQAERTVEDLVTLAIVRLMGQEFGAKAFAEMCYAGLVKDTLFRHSEHRHSVVWCAFINPATMEEDRRKWYIRMDILKQADTPDEAVTFFRDMMPEPRRI